MNDCIVTCTECFLRQTDIDHLSAELKAANRSADEANFELGKVRAELSELRQVCLWTPTGKEPEYAKGTDAERAIRS